MYDAVVPPFLLALSNLKSILTKAEANLKDRQIDPEALLRFRLYPDQFHLIRQVQTAADLARRGAVHLAGRTPEVIEDSEKCFGDLYVRLDASTRTIEALATKDFEGAAQRLITIPPGSKDGIVMRGDQCLYTFIYPGLHFHMTTAYAILRHNGVPLGKNDYLGALATISS